MYDREGGFAAVLSASVESQSVLWRGQIALSSQTVAVGWVGEEVLPQPVVVRLAGEA